MNFAAVFGASLCSGYALPACHPENGNPQRQPAELPPIKSGKLSRQSRPPLGTYLDKEQALLDAVDAAHDSPQAGCEAEVWIRGRPQRESSNTDIRKFRD